MKDAGLKLKESKCDFFKKEIHYLGHLISDKGMYPLPEKLDTIRNMLKPRNPKEIKQFLSLSAVITGSLYCGLQIFQGP